MTTLEQLSEARITPDLQTIVDTFAPGGALPARLAAGRDAALVTLQQYVPDFKYDTVAAEDAMRDVDAWASRNQNALEIVMASSAERLPEQLALAMGAERARSFVLSSFTQAAAGLGPWQSGAVARLAQQGDLINEAWARKDADQRLAMFALIVKMDRDGDLRSMFVPPTAVQGFGAAPALAIPAWLIVVLVVSLAAVLVTGILLWRRLSLNNRLMSDICARAQKEGDTATVAKCLDATRDLQKNALEETAGKIMWAGAAAAGVYFGLRYLVPLLRSRGAR